MNHSPLPWHLDKDIWVIEDNEHNPGQIASVSPRYCRAANAEFIVRAVNSFDDLLAALQAVVSVADRKTDEFDLARTAIAKATGGAAS